MHGGGHETNELSTALGKPPRFVTSVSGVESRYTDRETLEIFNMVYVGKMNKLYVERLQQLGVNAVGLCGADGRSMVGERKAAIKVMENGKRKVLRNDFTGRVEQINTELLTLLLDHGYTPVLCPPAMSYENEIINVDGDRMAAVLASAFKAKTLVILSNVPGLLQDVDDPDSLIASIDKIRLSPFFDLAQGRMKKKSWVLPKPWSKVWKRSSSAMHVLSTPCNRPLRGMAPSSVNGYITKESVMSAIQELENRYSTGIYAKRELTVVRGEGARLWDEDGKVYIDCIVAWGWPVWGMPIPRWRMRSPIKPKP